VSSTLTIILVGAFVASSCALVGSYLVLRKMALLGDAISHAVLLGIAVAFLITGSQSPLPMVIGAGAVGVGTVFLVDVLNRSRRIHEDASIGVVFPALFSIGVILINRYAGQVHLDMDCVLYGNIEFTYLDVITVGGREAGAKALWVTGAILLFDTALVLILWKELKLASFDPDLADSIGFSSLLIHYLLMLAVSVTIVGSFDSVGAILVVAMLIVPPATAYLLTNRLSVMLCLAVILGVASSVGGYYFARWCDCSIAGSMAAVAGAIFVLVFILAPGNGLLSRLLGHRRLGLRLQAQLLLLHLKRLADESHPHGRAAQPGPPRGQAADVARRFGWGRGRWTKVAGYLARKGLVEEVEGELQITSRGLEFLEEAGTAALAHRS
jgi:manganese/zinc/iron transport system permease protein